MAYNRARRKSMRVQQYLENRQDIIMEDEITDFGEKKNLPVEREKQQSLTEERPSATISTNPWE